MVSRDEVDAAVEKRFLGRRRTVAKLKRHVQSHPLPDAGLVHHFPDGQMGVRTVETANLQRLIFSHVLSPNFSLPLRRNPVACGYPKRGFARAKTPRTPSGGPRSVIPSGGEGSGKDFSLRSQ